MEMSESIASILKNEPIQGTIKCLQNGQIARGASEPEGFFELLNEERAKAYERGKEEGEKVGYAKAKEEMEAFLTLLQTITGKILEQKKTLFDELKPQFIEFAISLSERVIRIELSQPEKLAKLIESFLNHANFQGETLKIFLAPEDLVMMESQLSKLNYDKKEIKGVRFCPESLQKRGDVRIETKTSILNFSLSRELEDLRAKVLRQ
jgi:flagellar biosynthesis/type III secretory pathway protein FliH